MAKKKGKKKRMAGKEEGKKGVPNERRDYLQGKKHERLREQAF